MTEKQLETKFVKWCKSKEIVPNKGPAQMIKGFPDRFIQLPNSGGTVYVEFKGTSNYYGLTQIQEWWANYLKNSDRVRYYLIEDERQLERLIRICEALIKVGFKIVQYEIELIKEALDES